MHCLVTGKRTAGLLILVLSLCAIAAADEIRAGLSLGDGFHLLYNLDFDRAHQLFAAYEKQHPEDPMGPVCDAAGFLFSEFNRLGILESQFYEDDKAFDNRKKLALIRWFGIALTPL